MFRNSESVWTALPNYENKMAKLTKRAAAARARKAAKTRAFNKRSKAAKKGWRTRRTGGVRIVLGYVSDDNGFTVLIRIRPFKRLSDPNLEALCIRLIREGHFDDADVDGLPSDLQWAAGLITYSRVVERKIKGMQKGVAILEEFERESPV